MKKTNQAAAQNWMAKAVAVACLLLITWFAFAEATHFHRITASGSEENCEFCAVVHANAAAVPATAMLVVVPESVSTQIVFPEERNAPSLLHRAELYSRPPPLL